MTVSSDIPNDDNTSMEQLSRSDTTTVSSLLAVESNESTETGSYKAVDNNTKVKDRDSETNEVRT